MSLIAGCEDKIVDVKRPSFTPSATGGQTAAYTTVLNSLDCLIMKPSEEYQRLIQGLNLPVESVLYVTFGSDIREGDIVFNVFDKNSNALLQAATPTGLTGVSFLVLTVENPGGSSDYLRVGVRRWDGLDASI